MDLKTGSKLREIRQQKNKTIKETAQAASISESMISQIERDKISPSLETLSRICEGLDIELDYLFSYLKKKNSIQIVKKKERILHQVQGVDFEELSAINAGVNKKGIEAYRVKLAPGQLTENKKCGHPGYEIGIITKGRGQFHYGSDLYELQKGDSIAFAAAVPHKLLNYSTAGLEAYWITSPPKRFLK
ncbi:MAG TPA: helix-turn-helix domain-containing protein [Spirochaetota bacterium]|nr:helix-turn-helix domain-containing protein [Spirochaetota bacterium]